MKRFILAAFVVFISFASFSQNYSQAIGLKFPGGFAITYKKFVAELRAIEAQAMFGKESFRAVGLYEWHFNFTTIPELMWYVGPGVHFGVYRSEYKDEYKTSIDFGIDGVIGLDYKFAGAPVNISLDWQPAITFTGSGASTPAYGGLAIRYTF